MQEKEGTYSTARHGALIIDPFRYDATPSLRPLVSSAVLVNEQTKYATSEERHKREVQVKGVYIPENARHLSTC